MISNIKELIQKVTESENNISFVEKKELIENGIKNIYIEKISIMNNKKIKENKISIISEKKLYDSKTIGWMLESLNVLIGSFAFLFLFGVFSFNNTNWETINTLMFISFPVLCFVGFLMRKKVKIIEKQQSDNYYDETSLFPMQYMHKHYKHIVKDVSVNLIKELETITETELQKAKKHLSDYLVVNTFEFEEGHINNIFYKISNDVKEKIFIPEEPLKSKKLLSTEVKNRIQYNKLTITNIEEIKLKLISDVDNKVISK